MGGSNVFEQRSQQAENQRLKRIDANQSLTIEMLKELQKGKGESLLVAVRCEPSREPVLTPSVQASIWQASPHRYPASNLAFVMLI